MITNRDEVLISFASSILRHFKTIGIKGEYVLTSSTGESNPLIDSVIIKLNVYNSTVSTTVPYNVIVNVSSNLEALAAMRFELIAELTHGIEIAGNRVNGRGPKIKGIKHKRRRHRRSKK